MVSVPHTWMERLYVRGELRGERIPVLAVTEREYLWRRTRFEEAERIERAVEGAVADGNGVRDGVWKPVAACR